MRVKVFYKPCTSSLRKNSWRRPSIDWWSEHKTLRWERTSCMGFADIVILSCIRRREKKCTWNAMRGTTIVADALDCKRSHQQWFLMTWPSTQLTPIASDLFAEQYARSHLFGFAEDSNLLVKVFFKPCTSSLRKNSWRRPGIEWWSADNTLRWERTSCIGFADIVILNCFHRPTCLVQVCFSSSDSENQEVFNEILQRNLVESRMNGILVMGKTEEVGLGWGGAGLSFFFAERYFGNGRTTNRSCCFRGQARKKDMRLFCAEQTPQIMTHWICTVSRNQIRRRSTQQLRILSPTLPRPSRPTQRISPKSNKHVFQFYLFSVKFRLSLHCGHITSLYISYFRILVYSGAMLDSLSRSLSLLSPRMFNPPTCETRLHDWPPCHEWPRSDCHPHLWNWKYRHTRNLTRNIHNKSSMDFLVYFLKLLRDT